MAETYTVREEKSLVLEGIPKSDSIVLAQDAGATLPVPHGALIGKVAATGKFVVFDKSLTNGGADNLALWFGRDVTAAELVAGDVSGPNIAGGDVRVREDMINIDGADTLDSAYGTSSEKTARDILYSKGIFAQTTDTTTV